MVDAEKQHSGALYLPDDEQLLAEQEVAQELLWEYNQTKPSEGERRRELLSRMLADVGEGSIIEQPFHANWGGRFVHLGRGVYVNFGLSLVDDTHIYIGDHTMLGPNVTIATAGHPIAPELRGARPLQYNLPVTIGENCWIGAGATLLPGVSIGDGSVVGAGSVVSRDVPPGVVALGVPCRVLRAIGERDREAFRSGHAIAWDEVRAMQGKGSAS